MQSKPKSDGKHFSTGVEDVPAIFPALFVMTVQNLSVFHA